MLCSAALLTASCGLNTDDEWIASEVERYCSDCHNSIDFAGELDFERLDPAHVENDPGAWEAVVRKLRAGMMPPQDAPRPDAETYRQLVSRLESSLDAAAVVDPGRPALRRLNRAEYANAIHDLLDLEIDVTDLLPPDDSAYGFDNNSDLLVMSPALLERYVAAADRLSALAVGDQSTATGATTYTVPGDHSQALHLDGLPFGTVGGFAVEHYFPLDAEYEFDISLFRNNLEGIRGLQHEHKVEISIDGSRVLLEPIGAENEPEMPDAIITAKSDATDQRLRVRVPVAAGARTVTASFLRRVGSGSNRLRPFDRSNAGTYDSTGRPHIESLTVIGPFGATGPGDTAPRRRIFSCRPSDAVAATDCAHEILGRLARTAYRRPVHDDDLAILMPFFEQGSQGGSFDAGIQLALRRLLASPSFIFRIERNPNDVEPGTPHNVTDLELATRLSFFLWSSLPDDDLIELAAANRLHEPSVLSEQVRRMLADPRAAALTENFAGQWLHLRNLATIKPNTDFFPDFDNNLRSALRREAELFFASIVRENRSILDLLTANHTFLDERLARHYGIDGVYGSHFRRVELGPEQDARRGLLGKGAILMATSHADRTAPSLRGKWLFENLLGTPPPAPPPDVPELEAEPAAAPKTMRERLESHRGSPSCAGCHALIDPLGFALENFDAVGAWRDHEAGTSVDASGHLADGTPIDGVRALRAALVAQPELFAQTFVEKLMTYAIGRGLQHYDMPVVREILHTVESDDYRFEAIVIAIVNSPAFRMRISTDAGPLVATR